MQYLSFFFLLTFQVYASIPLKLSDKELASKTDHVFVAHVVSVDMIDNKGRKISNEKAMTGPGSKNIIRLKIKIDETLVTNAKKVPKYLYVPLDSFMHYRLGQVRKAHAGDNQKFLLLLSGDKFAPPLAGVFRRDLKRSSYFTKRIKKKHTETQKMPPKNNQ